MDDLVREIKQMTIKKPDPYVSPSAARISSEAEVKLNVRAISIKPSDLTPSRPSPKIQW
jgi:hypothetical protein